MGNAKETWAAVHAVLLEELQFRSGTGILIAEPDRLTDLVDNLTDAVIGKFEVVPRPRR